MTGILIFFFGGGGGSGIIIVVADVGFSGSSMMDTPFGN